MKVYINIKNNSNLHTHQTLNKRIWLMKRESGRSTTHHFSFGERFDETLMRCYFVCYQYVRLPNYQFIENSPLIKSAVGSNRGEHRHTQAGRTDFHPADRQWKADTTGEKKKATDNSRHHRRHRHRLLGTKSHSSLGRFLHAPLRLC